MNESKKGSLFVAALVVVAVVASCGPTGAEMIGDAFIDAGELLVDGGEMTRSDAQAQACGMNCSATGTQRVITADSDPAQLRSGATATVGTLVSGPFVLTDLTVGGSSRIEISSGPSGSCTSLVYELSTTAGRVGLNGARVFIPEGEELCISPGGGPGTVRWAGFVPYD